MTGRLISGLICAVAAVLIAGAHGADSAAPVPHLMVRTDAAEVIVGTAGDDAIYGRGGDDQIDGGPGNDDLDGGAGADDVHGGPGNDAVSYAADDRSVTVTLDDRPDDGLPGEHDNVHTDVEDIYGGGGDDKLVGDGAANTLDGGEGDDTLIGGGGVDGLYGGGGRDFIDARDGEPDTVDCGPGRDRALLDVVDVEHGCERTNVATIQIANIASVPDGVPRSQVCRGTMHMVLERGHIRLESATVTVRSDCHYGFTFRVLWSRIGTAKRLTLALRASGSTKWFRQVVYPHRPRAGVIKRSLGRREGENTP